MGTLESVEHHLFSDNNGETSIINARFKLFSDDSKGRELKSPVLHMSIDNSKYFPIGIVNIEEVSGELTPVRGGVR